jgi:hypothetical protein
MAHRTADTGRESGQTLVLFVSDPSDSKHGEISVLDTAQEAERTIETLLEAGFEQQRIRVFSAAQVDFEISYRPVVTLLSGASDEATHLNHQGGNGSEPRGVEVEPDANPSTAEARSGNGHSGPDSPLSSVFRSDACDIRDEAGTGPMEAYMSGNHCRSQARFSSFSRSMRDEPSYRSVLGEVA